LGPSAIVAHNPARPTTWAGSVPRKWGPDWRRNPAVRAASQLMVRRRYRMAPIKAILDDNGRNTRTKPCRHRGFLVRQRTGTSLYTSGSPAASCPTNQPALKWGPRVGARTTTERRRGLHAGPERGHPLGLLGNEPRSLLVLWLTGGWCGHCWSRNASRPAPPTPTNPLNDPPFLKRFDPKTLPPSPFSSRTYFPHWRAQDCSPAPPPPPRSVGAQTQLRAAQSLHGSCAAVLGLWPATFGGSGLQRCGGGCLGVGRPEPRSLCVCFINGDQGHGGRSVHSSGRPLLFAATRRGGQLVPS